MSDSWIVLIPEDPHFVPTTDRRRNAESRARAFAPEADEVSSATSDAVVFHDCGANFEGVACPRCASALSLEWWGDAMDVDAEEGSFSLALHELPCCGGAATLHELRYEGTQGFARYALEIRNANVELSSVQVDELASLLGCPVRVIQRHL